jgi:thiamine-monophosphate kinase
MIGEFALIAKYFAPLAARSPGALGLQDDAAVIDLTPGYQVVITADSMVAGVHFLADDPADLVARKLLRVNLSDLAAMGAEPRGYLLTINLPAGTEEPWVARFAAGLARDQAAYGVGLLGGDTTRTPGPLSMSLTALGEVLEGRALRRATASAGDLVAITGTLGDAALGLVCLEGGLDGLDPNHRDFLVDRYRLPQPRVDLGGAVAGAGLATAAIDVSDGLVADLGHICETGGLGAVIESGVLPLSAAARRALRLDPERLSAVLAGGVDYELLFTVRPGEEDAVVDLAAETGTEVTFIGRMTDGQGVLVLDEEGREIELARSGWTHL